MKRIAYLEQSESWISPQESHRELENVQRKTKMIKEM